MKLWQDNQHRLGGEVSKSPEHQHFTISILAEGLPHIMDISLIRYESFANAIMWQFSVRGFQVDSASPFRSSRDLLLFLFRVELKGGEPTSNPQPYNPVILYK